VASHRVPKKSGRAALTIATATAATAAGVAISPSAANAQSLSQVKAEVDQLNKQAEVATNAYDGATEQLAKLQAQVSQLQGRIATEQASVTSLQDSLGTLAAAQYRDSGMDQTLQLMLSQHPDQFLQQSTTLDELTAQETASLKQLQQAERQMKQDTVQASQELGQIQSTEKTLATAKATAEAKLHEAQLILNGLTSSQVSYINGASVLSLSNLPSVSGRAGMAIAFAQSKLGDPYVLGGTGPTEYDCSGLTQAAWAAAGVSLPRTTWEQYAALPHIPESALQPGDLVFFDNLGHVGIYVGGGWIEHAPHSGTVVRYEQLSNMQSTYYGAARVV
jgi:cell wall-associated NlpC family hydrolase